MENDKFKLQRKILSNKIYGSSSFLVNNRDSINNDINHKNISVHGIKKSKGCSSCSRKKNARG